MYERLLNEAEQDGLDTYEIPMPPNLKGLYCDGTIWLNRNKPTAEKTCALAEESGHYHTSVGDILDQTIAAHRKQELRARQWAYNRLVPLSAIVQAYKRRIQNRHDFADYLGVTEEFLQASIDRYRDKYGLFTKYGDYTIYFDPLAVLELFDSYY